MKRPDNPYFDYLRFSWQRGFDGVPLGDWAEDAQIKAWHRGREDRKVWDASPQGKIPRNPAPAKPFSGPDLSDNEVKKLTYIKLVSDSTVALRALIKKYPHWDNTADRGMAFAFIEGLVPSLAWTDDIGCIHRIPWPKAEEILKEFFQEWPGGLDEIQSALRTARQPRIKRNDKLAIAAITAELVKTDPNELVDAPDEAAKRIYREVYRALAAQGRT